MSNHLVEVAVDDCVLWQPVLLPRGDHDLLGHLLSRGGLGGDQVGGQAVLQGEAVHRGLHLPVLDHGVDRLGRGELRDGDLLKNGTKYYISLMNK